MSRSPGPGAWEDEARGYADALGSLRLALGWGEDRCDDPFEAVEELVKGTSDIGRLEASIPRKDLLVRAEERLAAIRARPLMYGGTWQGVEVVILAALDDLDFLLAWPAKPHKAPVVARWAAACCRVHRVSGVSLAATLKSDGITDYAVVQAKFNAVLDAVLEPE